MTDAAIRFSGVTKAFGLVRAVDDVSFDLPQGALVTLLGPSGCGRTTTLRLVAGLELPTAGRIEIEGRDVTRLAAAERRIAMVFQSCALFPHMSVLENVSYGLVVGGARRQAAEAEAGAMLATLGLDGLGARLPAELSGGQQQRVALAVSDLVVVVMKEGRIAQKGTPAELYDDPADAFVADFMGEANVLQGVVLGEGRISLGGAVLETAMRAHPVGPAALAVRPESIRLLAPEQDGMPGRVQRAAFLGQTRDYEVETATRLT